MLTSAPVFTTIPVTDLSVSKKFYQEQLGLQQIPDPSTHGYMFMAGERTKLFIYRKDVWAKDEHVIAAFFVENIAQSVDALAKNGVEFLKSMKDVTLDEKGIATGEKEKAAWFVDPDRNVLSLSQFL